MKPKTSLLTFLGIGLLIFSISCKKFDTAQEPYEAMGNSYEEKFFNYHRTSDSKENAIVNYVKKINEKENFVNNAVKQIGFPRWDKITCYANKKNANSFANNNDSTYTYFIPFVRDSQVFVNASLIITANSSDTTFQFKYDWQYLQMQNTPNSVLDSAENFAIMFMRLDKAVFGYKKFSITDHNLFKRNNKNAIHVELLDSLIQNNLYEQVTCTSVTITYNDCYAPDSDECSGGCDGCWWCTAAIHITSCTEGSGGGSSGGSGIPTGGGPSGSSGNGGCSGCGGGGQGSSGNPSGGGWVPLVFDDETLQDILDLQWMNHNVKDSTNNPCDSIVIATIKNMDTTLPRLFRNIFGSNAQIKITIKTTNQGSSQGAETLENFSTNDFKINLNSYFSNATTLSKAASLLHESIHANLMFLYQQAVIQNNLIAKQQIESDFLLFFDSTKIAANPNLSYIDLMNQHQVGQHQIMSFQHIRNAMADALLSFAKSLDSNTSVDLNYCKKLAWTGTFDSKGYKNLSAIEKEDIEDIISGERGNNPDQANFNQIGKACP